MTASVHLPVLLHETMKYLQPQKGKRYLDATVGNAGHSLALLETGAEVIGVDQDGAMLKRASERVKEAGYADHFTPVHKNFADALASTPPGSLDGVLFDLGVSSYQLDTGSRGFSFRFNALLDMRMDPDNQQVTARDLVNGLGKNELVELFERLGEEPRAKKIAEAIVAARKVKQITTTDELATLIESISPRRSHLHPATLVFQALRMAVNSERGELQAALPSAWNSLRDKGTLVAISFHSLEDQIVKEFMTSSNGELMTPKPVTPSAQELATNPRARSAKLRVLRKIVV